MIACLRMPVATPFGMTSFRADSEYREQGNPATVGQWEPVAATPVTTPPSRSQRAESFGTGGCDCLIFTSQSPPGAKRDCHLIDHDDAVKFGRPLPLIFLLISNTPPSITKLPAQEAEPLGLPFHHNADELVRILRGMNSGDGVDVPDPGGFLVANPFRFVPGKDSWMLKVWCVAF